METPFRVRGGCQRARGPSTPQNGSQASDSAPVGMTELGDLNIPTQAKAGLEGATLAAFDIFFTSLIKNGSMMVWLSSAEICILGSP